MNKILKKYWIKIKNLFRGKKVCYQVKKYGKCNLHNIHCSYPKCEMWEDEIEFNSRYC